MELRSGSMTLGTGSNPGGRRLLEVVETAGGGVDTVETGITDVIVIVVTTSEIGLVMAGEVVEAAVEDAPRSGSIVRVTVTVPDDIVTVAVLVNSSMEVIGVEALDPAVPDVGVAVTAPVDEAVGSNALGTVPRIPLATAMSLHPSITPSVVFMGNAKQALPAGQGMSSKLSPLAQVPMLPAIHAAWPSLQADCAVRVAKISLYFRASARLLSNTAGDTVPVEVGGGWTTVGIAVLGAPVAVRVADEGES
jgi:hypothetical protein